MDVRILPLAEVRERARDIWDVYDEVFGDQPSYDVWLDQMLLRHAARDRFRLAAAFDSDQMIGFAYGYVGASGQYYTDSVRESLGAVLAARWLPAFEFVEFGVLASHRRGGVGRRLYELVIDGIDGPALLSTGDDDDDPAVRFYRGEGWSRLGEHPSADGARTMQIMGLRR
ncbi:GNAT family N-acetyltransferase [Microbacterium karelineae]|uniref:GNAT family N-acetyltransferase n=1 Tax=Microbacterium karelineae TaxID=2654283 RepID=UPI0012E9F63E|nr:GNAT family N-acetyltransferase [Microbacterium karelineae]